MIPTDMVLRNSGSLLIYSQNTGINTSAATMLADWADYPFIMADIRMNTGQYTRMLFQHYERTPHTVLEVASLQFIYSAVRQNIGITIAPSMPLVQPDHVRLHYLSFEDDRQIQWHFTAIRKLQAGRTGLLEELVETVKCQYGPAGAGRFI